VGEAPKFAAPEVGDPDGCQPVLVGPVDGFQYVGTCEALAPEPPSPQMKTKRPSS
jgi:hypothetical protein